MCHLVFVQKYLTMPTFNDRAVCCEDFANREMLHPLSIAAALLVSLAIKPTEKSVDNSNQEFDARADQM